MAVVKDGRTQASDQVRRHFDEAVMNPERLDEIRGMLADDYVHVDRRSVVGLPDLDGAGFIESLRIGHEAGLDSFDRQLVARLGDRLFLSHVKTRFTDGSEKQYLVLNQWDRDVAKVEQSVRFDPDDLDAATAELDRLYAELD